MNTHKLSPQERKSALALAAIYALRMLGLFMLLPVLALYAHQLPTATPLLAGLAVGVYGLTQALLQIPFGALSDKLGRKKVIYFGLLLFAIGSVMAALVDNIYWLIVARALQGAGAVAAAIMALAADLSRPEQRAKVMALIGVAIGGAFLLALMLGALLGGLIGVKGLFWLAFLQALLAMWLLKTQVPNPQHQSHERQVTWAGLAGALKNRQLMALDAAIFLLHALLTALFVLLPFIFEHQFNLPAKSHWHIYLPILLLSLLLALPWIVRSARAANAMVYIQTFVALLVIFAAGSLFLSAHFWALLVCLWLFFGCFNVLEALLPAQISKTAPEALRGAALGVYSSCQFLGSFAGALLAGVVLKWLLAGQLSFGYLGAGVLVLGALWWWGLKRTARAL